ncbi:MAG: DNA translocase FtsK [Planctomycetota bacterium]|nr:DNA translocase FtsK [Planctomycetota bacterium]
MRKAKDGGELELVEGGGNLWLLAVFTGLGLAGLGIFLFLSFATADIYLDPADSARQCWTGLVGAWLSFWVLVTLGKIPALALAVLVTAWGVRAVRARCFLATWPQVLGGVVVVVALAMGLCAVRDRYDLDTGGLLAVYASPPALLFFGNRGLALVALFLLVAGVLLAFGEFAIFGVKTTILSAWNSFFVSLAFFRRLLAIIRLLATPRLVALANAGGTGMARVGTASDPTRPLSRPTRLDKAKTDDSEPAGTVDAEGEGREDKPDLSKVWQPREKFVSRFVDQPQGAETPPAREDPEPWVVAPSEEVPLTLSEADFLPVPVTGKTVRRDFVKEPLREVVVESEEREAPVARPAVPSSRPVVRPAASSAPAVSKGIEHYEIPPLAILDPIPPPAVENRGELERCSRILEKTLAEFKIEGRVVHVERGPRVTLYEISLAPGIRLSKVTSLSDNLAMQLKAESVRIIAPIPGKDTIGIEIPNLDKELVVLKEIVASVNREKRRQALPVCLGKDVSGQSLVADLTKMPHLLIAGATGSGKSVCINSIIMSILMCCRPEETQLILIDPKVVELSRFKDIPHLMSPVITDMKRAVSVLDWLCQKMDERYEQMSQVAVNNIAKFNALGEEEIRRRLDAYSSLEEIEAFPKHLPYMVVIIDELADLMMVAGKEVEHHITRLAAKSRAVGIHLILATQRPSVDVITGLIKANMPCRIAFQVASRVDSRTILDQNGAEALLGQGDLLYLPPGVGKLTRSQGVYVSDEELFRVVDFVKAEALPQYHPDLLGPVIGGDRAVDVSEFDELFLEAGEAIIENQRGSVSLLQRKFGIGYGRASRLIDQLAAAGVLGAFRDGKAREILLSMEEFDAKFRESEEDDSEDDGKGSLAGLRLDEEEPSGTNWEDGEEDAEE